jgi:hypothetical protein
MTVDTSAFWKDGYTIVRNVFTKQEIEQLREAAYEARRSGPPGDLLSKPTMRHVLLDGRLVDITRRVLGRDDIVYYGDSAFTVTPGRTGYHKDNADRTDRNAPDWKSPYTQLRLGVYLQDHYRHSGGLNVRQGSHNKVSNKLGETVYLRTRVGDVGVWSMRTSHSGAGTLLRFPRTWHPSPGNAERIPRIFKAPPDRERISVFAALGADDEHADRYVQYLKTRAYMVASFRSSSYDDEVYRLAKEIGLRIRDVGKEIEGDETVGQNEDWKPIPY